jgi:hypothetical protein
VGRVTEEGHPAGGPAVEGFAVVGLPVPTPVDKRHAAAHFVARGGEAGVQFLGAAPAVLALKAEGTKETYAPDYRLFFSYLWRRGLRWDEATADVLEDWEDWRLRGEGNPSPIGGARWARELAALGLFYKIAVRLGFMQASPRAHAHGDHTGRQHGGGRGPCADGRPQLAREVALPTRLPDVAGRGSGRDVAERVGERELAGTQ